MLEDGTKIWGANLRLHTFMSNFAIATHYNQQGCRYTFYSHPFGALISIITPPVYEGQLGLTFNMQIYTCYM